MNVKDAITKRSSTRGYTEEALTDEELKLILEAGLKAPTAANKQEIFFSVLKGDNPVLKELEDEKNRLRNIDKAEHNFYYEAPTVIFLSADKEYKWSPLDAGIAVENMALQAEELGLGNLIIGCVYDALRGDRREEFESKLGIPAGYEYEIAIAVGHKGMEKTPHSYDWDKQVKVI
ncbi:MAG: nitroreductase family protein [Lachnospiraceae bacterium]|nr:nitroreductase family protein [Lachnospiraceae bacterium]